MLNGEEPVTGETFHRAVTELLQDAGTRAYHAAKFATVEGHWQVGRMMRTSRFHNSVRTK